MKRYAALLRGINVSGKNKIAMPELRKMFYNINLTEVSTLQNSGNVLFSSDLDDRGQISRQIRDGIFAAFGLDVPVYVTEIEHLREILSHAPGWWGTRDKGTYHNLIFILTDETPEAVSHLIGEPSEGWEQVMPSDDVIFWSFDLGHYQKCNWWKRTASAGIAEKLTIRTANTIRRLCI